MSAANAGTFDEQVGVRAKLLISLAEDVTGEDYARVIASQFLKAGFVLLRVGGIAHDHALQVRLDAVKRFDNVMGAIFGDQPPDEQNVFPRLQPELCEGLARRKDFHVRAVGDVIGFAAILFFVILLYVSRIGQVAGWEDSGEIFRKLDVFLRQRRPFLAAPVQPVHVQERARTRQARNPGHGTVPRDEVKSNIETLKETVEGRQKRVDDGVQVFVGDGGQLHQPHPLVFGFGVGDVMTAAIDSHLVAARRQTLSQLFHAGFKSAVTGGDAARAEKGDFHGCIVSRN
ncbi:MAG: hypothetical protein HONDAALG_01793 [Gammaproteobacteria bacterium]|nr:hypothetical protein [Gammaproteobacteria bacterium]